MKDVQTKNPEPPKLVDTPVVKFLTLLVTVFLAGLATYKWIENSLDERIKQVHGPLIEAYLRDHPPVSIASSSLPKNAVVAFYSTDCPSGWRVFTQASGRFVLGVENAAGTRSGLGHTGGSDAITLTESNLPKHNHGLVGVLVGQLPWGSGKYSVPVASDEGGQYHYDWSSGQGIPVSIMPPHVALLYCIKD